MRSKDAMVAYALEMDEKLLPYATELLEDLEELGSDAEAIAELLESLQLPETTRVLDLGCGKGAVAIEIAQELGWQVDGIDLHAPFMPECEAAARSAGVGHLCRFRAGDIVELSRTVDREAAHSGGAPGTVRYDVVVMAALGDVLGSWDATVAILRRFVVPGGYLLLSDGYLDDGASADFPGFENYLPREQMIQLLESQGDTLVRAVIDEADEADEAEEGADTGDLAGGDGDDGNDRAEPDHISENRLVRERAEALAAKHPELATDFLRFADGQEAEGEYLDQNFVDVLWLLQRGPDATAR